MARKQQVGAGALSDRAEIRELDDATANAYNEILFTEDKVTTRWCSVEATTGGEESKAGQVRQSTSYTVKFREDNVTGAITSKYRLKIVTWGNITLEIESVIGGQYEGNLGPLVVCQCKRIEA